jgi:hypothetical protein
VKRSDPAHRAWRVGQKESLGWNVQVRTEAFVYGDTVVSEVGRFLP